MGDGTADPLQSSQTQGKRLGVYSPGKQFWMELDSQPLAHVKDFNCHIGTTKCFWLGPGFQGNV